MKFSAVLLLAPVSLSILAGASPLASPDEHSAEHADSDPAPASVAPAESQPADKMPGMSSSNLTMDPSPASMHIHNHHNRKSILEDPNLEPQQRAYWEQYDPTTFLSAPASNKFFLYSHIVLNVASWAFIYPVSLALSVAKSPFYLFVQTFQLGVFMVALFCLAVYGATAPPLYPGNSYSKLSVAMLFISGIHWGAAVISALAKWAMSSQGSPMDGADYVLTNLDESSRPIRGTYIRPSQDSGHAIDSPQDNFSDLEDSDHATLYPTQSPSTSFETATQNKIMARIMSNKRVFSTVSKLEFASKIIYAIINRPLFVLGMGYLIMGSVTLYRLGISNNIYNILAHFIKGAIFFLYGILTLLRYLGAFADNGMAWNIAPGSALDPTTNGKSKTRYVPGSRRRNILAKLRPRTMEFVECFLIFVYGCSNVFMEHLGNQDGKWSHKDLQHVSIAFMYFGGGLCGLLVESRSVRRLINRTVSTSNNDEEDDFNSGLTGSISINPFPAFIVFWTGALMSQHEQMLPLSTSIHMQWGYLLASAAVFRIGTYILIFLNPPKSTVPSRPLTELIASFGLVCGGLVFIQSNSETVEAMMWRSLDSMFTLVVNVGITSLIMAWTMVVMTIKAWATVRTSKLSLDPAHV